MAFAKLWISISLLRIVGWGCLVYLSFNMPLEVLSAQADVSIPAIINGPMYAVKDGG